MLALHHHPLPQSTGEGRRFLGAADEPLMHLGCCTGTGMSLPRENGDVEERVRQRLQVPQNLNGQVKPLGLDLGLGGEAPPPGIIPR